MLLIDLKMAAGEVIANDVCSLDPMEDATATFDRITLPIELGREGISIETDAGSVCPPFDESPISAKSDDITFALKFYMKLGPRPLSNDMVFEMLGISSQRAEGNQLSISYALTNKDGAQEQVEAILKMPTEDAVQKVLSNDTSIPDDDVIDDMDDVTDDGVNDAAGTPAWIELIGVNSKKLVIPLYFIS